MQVTFEPSSWTGHQPTEAIVFYGPYALMFPVRTEAGKFVYGEPRQLKKSDLQSLLMLIEHEYVPSAYLPEHILAYDHQRTVWYTKAQQQPLYFRTTDPALQALSGQMFWQPALLFVAQDKKLQVYALASDDRPTPETALYLPPYYNITEGAVCLGSTAIPASIHPDHTTKWVDAFFSSSFTHGTHHRIQRHKGSHAEMWLDVQAEGQFNPEYLLPANKTLLEVLK